MSFRELPVPPFYDPAHAADWAFQPDPQALLDAALRWRREHGLRPASGDRKRVHLLLIDVQRDFCFPQGTLYVGGRSGTGAVDDNDRIASFLYRNLEAIGEITCTLDTHYPFQIFFPAFWVGEDGLPPAPHQEVTVADLRAGRLRPNPEIAPWVAPEGGGLPWLERQVEFYCQELERAGKYRLYLWPLHCLLGGDGHALSGVVQEARLFHAFARSSRAAFEIKGDNPLTENYSVLAPEVRLRHDGGRLAGRNEDFLRILLEADAVVIAGQAASHCVKSSIEDFLDALRASHGEAAELIRKVYVLEDCMSSVTVPDPARPGQFLADFTPQAEEALRRFAEAGMHVVRSTEPMAEWPGMGL
jgi:nicotinamidase-related amidase